MFIFIKKKKVILHNLGKKKIDAIKMDWNGLLKWIKWVTLFIPIFYPFFANTLHYLSIQSPGPFEHCQMALNGPNKQSLCGGFYFIVRGRLVWEVRSFLINKKVDKGNLIIWQPK